MATVQRRYWNQVEDRQSHIKQQHQAEKRADRQHPLRLPWHWLNQSERRLYAWKHHSTQEHEFHYDENRQSEQKVADRPRRRNRDVGQVFVTPSQRIRLNGFRPSDQRRKPLRNR